jgi:hypothetical protein
MSDELTVTLPSDLSERAKRLAETSGREVNDVLTTILELSLPPLPLSPSFDSTASLSELSNEQILALTELEMLPEPDSRLSDLLEKQQTDGLTELEQIEHQSLLRVYELGLLRKSQALAEAVKRGLREPLES